MSRKKFRRIHHLTIDFLPARRAIGEPGTIEIIRELNLQTLKIILPGSLAVQFTSCHYDFAYSWVVDAADIQGCNLEMWKELISRLCELRGLKSFILDYEKITFLDYFSGKELENSWTGDMLAEFERDLAVFEEHIRQQVCGPSKSEEAQGFSLESI